MAKGRVYTVQFHNVLVSAIQDLFAVYCGANMAVALHGIEIGQITATAVQNLQISVKRLPTAVTAGTGGATPVPQKVKRGNSAATVTARTNDMTTQASTSGAAAILHSDVFNLVNGYQMFFPPDDQPDAGPNEALVVSLDSAPLAGVYMSGTLYIEELF